MTRAEHDRRKRQMNRRIREVLTVRRMLAAMGPLVDPRIRQRTTAESVTAAFGYGRSLRSVTAVA